jgi:DNA invertase Pin-like site-specific DNA recombinase
MRQSAHTTGLIAYCAENGFEMFKAYIDTTTSGGKGRDSLFVDAANGKFETVVVWALDDWSHSMVDSLTSIKALLDMGIKFRSVTEQFDTITASGVAHFNSLYTSAMLKRATVRDNICMGMELARSKGKQIGRRIKTTEQETRRILEMRADGRSIREIAKTLQITRGATASALERHARTDTKISA